MKLIDAIKRTTYAIIDNGHAVVDTEEFKRLETELAQLKAERTLPLLRPEPPYQLRVNDWMRACFGPEIAADRAERNHRFLEEALELAQACGCAIEDAHKLVDYTFNRPVGEPAQEVGGVMVTLATLCEANSLYMNECGEIELTRIWTKMEQIRAKQATKPKSSPLPTEETPTPKAPLKSLQPIWKGQFDTFNEWVNTASRVLTNGPPNSIDMRLEAICVDSLGRRCVCGGDFMRANRQHAFPVRYFYKFELV